MSTAPRLAFVSYSHDDERHLKELIVTLKALDQDMVVKPWYDKKLQPSDAWHELITAKVKEAEMAVLLLSRSFLASEYIRKYELPVLIEAWRTRGLPIYVVVVGPYSEVASSELKEIQFVNMPNRPLSKLTKAQRDECWVALEDAIRGTVAQATQVSPAPVPGLFLVPHLRNPYFSGREDELAAIHKALQTDGNAGIVQAIKGLGGIGKTQLALEYLYRHIEDYAHIAWVRADTTTTLDEDYRALAQKLKLPLPEPTIEHVREAVKDWLSREKDYLLILDNADDPAVVEPYLPVLLTGKVLVTSRSSNLTKLGVKQPRALDCWTQEQGADFLLKRIADQTEGDAELARTLSERLGGLPLALEQAGAYLAETESSLASYLEAYDRQGHQLLEKHGPEIGHQRTVATTWALNIEKIAKSSPVSLDLLRAASFLAPENIPFELFQKGAKAFDEDLGARLTDELAVGELLAPLRRFSLVSVDSASRTFYVHPLVQSVVAESLATTERNEWRSRMLEALNAAFPYVEDANWFQCERLVPHALQVVEGFEDVRITRLLNQVAYFLDSQGDLSGARPLYERALAIREKVLGFEHPDTAVSLNNLAGLLDSQGDFLGARPLYERALAIREKVFGPEHPDTALSLNNLASVLYAQGDLLGARPLCERALAVFSTLLPPFHPYLTMLRGNVATLYEQLGMTSEAADLRQKAEAGKAEFKRRNNL